MIDRELQRSPAESAERVWDRIDAVDKKILALLERAALPLLRISLAAVFIWFGALKIVGETPVADLVAATVYWLDPGWVVPLLGILEVLVGLGLLLGE